MLIAENGRRGKARQIPGLFPDSNINGHSAHVPNEGTGTTNRPGIGTALHDLNDGDSSTATFFSVPNTGNSFCTHCGQPVNSAAIACPQCGAPPRTGRNYCRNCGAPRRSKQIICLKCGSSLKSSISAGNGSGSQKSRISAALLAFLLGGIGIQKFYMGSWGWGIIFVVVGFMTCGFVTGIASLVDGIMWLCMSDDDFAAKYPPETEGPMRY